MSPTEDFCPIAGCQRTRHVTQVMCTACWARCPVAYQRQVLVRRKQVARAVKGSNPSLLAAAMKLYRQACGVAIESVQSRQQRAAGVQAVAQ